jgi:hypothetical protein
MAPSLKAKILNYDNLTMSENAKTHTLLLTHTNTLFVTFKNSFKIVQIAATSTIDQLHSGLSWSGNEIV